MAKTATLPTVPTTLKVCLAASGGGHVRQLLDLQPVWSKHDYFFVTEDTALGKSLAESHPTSFLQHVAVGQIRIRSPLAFGVSLLKNLMQSARVIFSARPDVVISSGAGAVFFTVLFSRLSGARTIVIESFARFDGPSLFFRAAAFLAHIQIVQSEKLSHQFPRAQVFDPLRLTGTAPSPKKPLIFATVGATLPFDRLVELVSTAKLAGRFDEELILQVGTGGMHPYGIDVHETLPFSKVQEILREASIVVCHGGTGSIITALQNGCHVIAIARRADLAEHYDDHQREIIDAFHARGLIEVATSEDELVAAIHRAKQRDRVIATTDHTALSAFLDEELRKLSRVYDRTH